MESSTGGYNPANPMFDWAAYSEELRTTVRLLTTELGQTQLSTFQSVDQDNNLNIFVDIGALNCS